MVQDAGLLRSVGPARIAIQSRARRHIFRFFTFNPAECEELHVADLEVHRVYTLESQRNVVSPDHMGEGCRSHPVPIGP
jgi:hypothetical protein